MSRTKATAVEAAKEFIDAMPANFETFVGRVYGLTTREAGEAAARFRRELDDRIERERAGAGQAKEEASE